MSSENGRPEPGASSEERLRDSDLPVGTIVDHRYEISRALGRGGFATVYLAHDRELNRDVALKVLHEDLLDSSALARLKREAAVAREVRDEGLIHIYDFGRSEGIAYLAMELVDGRNLAEALAAGPLATEGAVSTARSVLRALLALHQRGLVHRDVKPSNILLPVSGQAKLADLGVLRRLEGGESVATEANAILGTIDYLAPELLRGEEATPASDLYSLGAVLYETLAGTPPFPSGTGVQSAFTRLRAKPKEIRRLQPGVPPWLAHVVHRLLEKDPRKRYPSAAVALLDLERRPRPLFHHRPRLALRAALISLLLLTVVGWRASREARSSQVRSPFSHVASRGPGSFAGIAANGTVLWSSAGFESQPVPFRASQLGPARLAATCGPPPTHSFARSRRLCVFDAQSGGLDSVLRLPTAARLFPGFSRTYASRVVAQDLDGDGGDELLVTSLELPYWPSYTVLYEPRIGRSRIVFVASGHHYFVGSADLDGSGHRDLLFVGINNLMGWNHGLAAVRVDPPVDQAGNAPLADAACTPDHLRTRGGTRNLLWYVLLPSKFGVAWDASHYIQLEPSKRLILLRAPDDGSELAITYDGFLASDRSNLPAAERRKLRAEAYASLREATTSEQSGHFRAAAREAQRAHDLAARSADTLLAQWAARRRGVALVEAHRFSTAQTLFERLWDGSSDNNLAYDAGKSFYLNGRPELALSWFRRGLGPRINPSHGRQPREFIDGEFFCLYTLGRTQAALLEIQRASNAYPKGSLDFSAIQEFLRWREGETPRDLAAIYGGDLGPGVTDLVRYLNLEFRWSWGIEPGALMPDIERELHRSTETLPLLLSLKAEVLEHEDKLAAALAAAQRAVEGVAAQRHKVMILRAFEDLPLRRLVEIAKRAHRPTLERLGEKTLSRWREKLLTGWRSLQTRTIEGHPKRPSRGAPPR